MLKSKKDDKDKKGVLEDIKIIARSLKFYRKVDKVMLPVTVSSAVLNAVQPFIVIFLSGILLDALYEGKDIYTMIIYAVIGVSARLILDLVGCYLGKIYWTKKRNLHNYQGILLSDRMMNMNYEYIEDENIQNMVRKQMEYSQAFGGAYYTLFDRLQIVITTFVSICISVFAVVPLFFRTGQAATAGERFINSPLFSVIIIIIIGAGIVLSINATKKMQKTGIKLQEKQMNLNRNFFYYFDKFLYGYETGKDIRLFNMKNLIDTENEKLIKNQKKYTDKMVKLTWNFELINQPISTLTGGIVYLFVGLRSIIGAISIGNVVSYAGCIIQFIKSFSDFLTNLSALKYNNVYMEEMNYLLNLGLEDEDKNVQKKKISMDSKEKFNIEFKHVYFRYPGTNNDVIKDLNMSLDMNGRMAIVGRNGSGKTTFIKLLCRLYEPTQGQILLNGKDIRNYDYDEYIKLFSVVFQDSRVFSFPIGNNVAASEAVDDKRVVESLKKADMGKFLEKMPNGINTYVYKDFDRDGVEISGGEAQRMEIARAIYQDRQFVIMDEPTAALDPIAEYEVYVGFNEMIGDKTAIYISHRLSSCRFCSDIIVFDDGNIIQRGSHEKLVNKDGLYSKMWNAQAQYYSDAESEAALEN